MYFYVRSGVYLCVERNFQEHLLNLIIMRHSLFLLFQFILISTAGRSQQNVYNCLTNERFEFIQNAKLVPDLYHKSRKIVDTGSNIIFRIYRLYDCPNVFDEEMEVVLKWSIPWNINSFQITFNPSDSLTLPVDYSAEGLGSPQCPQYFRTAEGHINGTQNDNIWSIQGNVTVVYYNDCNKKLERMLYTISNNFILWKKEKRKKYRSIPF